MLTNSCFFGRFLLTLSSADISLSLMSRNTLYVNGSLTLSYYHINPSVYQPRLSAGVWDNRVDLDSEINVNGKETVYKTNQYGNQTLLDIRSDTDAPCQNTQSEQSSLHCIQNKYTSHIFFIGFLCNSSTCHLFLAFRLYNKQIKHLHL